MNDCNICLDLGAISILDLGAAKLGDRRGVDLELKQRRYLPRAGAVWSQLSRLGSVSGRLLARSQSSTFCLLPLTQRLARRALSTRREHSSEPIKCKLSGALTDDGRRIGSDRLAPRQFLFSVGSPPPPGAGVAVDGRSSRVPPAPGTATSVGSGDPGVGGSRGGQQTAPPPPPLLSSRTAEPLEFAARIRGRLCRRPTLLNYELHLG